MDYVLALIAVAALSTIVADTVTAIAIPPMPDCYVPEGDN
jgi:hypothetical protein